MPSSFTIAGLASASGVNIQTVRYYQRRGLMREPPRPLGGVRRYSDADAERLRFIKRAQAVGFTLAEVQSLMSLRTRQSCHATRDLVAAKLDVVNERISDLQHLRHELTQWVADCDANNKDSVCPGLSKLDATAKSRS